MSVVVVAEKPSVARDIAAVVGAHGRRQGFLEGGRYKVTWAVGHLVGLAQPHEIDPAWRSWRRDRLPMLPERWPLSVLDGTRDQFEVVRSLLTDPEVEEIVCATDAGREGELIFRFIYEASRAKKPVRRLWISSLTAEAIRAGLSRLRPSSEFDRLAQAARGRAQADWLVGMNLSRAYTLSHGDMLSVGRVQTPTLALLVAREKEIQGFVPEKYQEVVATFEAPAQPATPVGTGEPKAGGLGAAPAELIGRYRGTWFRHVQGNLREANDRLRRRLPPDGVLAEQIKARVLAAGRGEILELSEETRRLAPPLLYDLSELQRHANRLFGFSAQRTLEIAQRLYEQKKLLSYPRTDSRHLSTEIAATLGDVVSAISGPYQRLLAPGTGTAPLGRRFVDDAKVSDHHAIIPTPTDPSRVSLSPEEAKIYDLVCRRLLSAWHGDHVYASTTVITRVAPEDFFHSAGTRVLDPGWKVLDLRVERPPAKKGREDEEEPTDLPTGLAKGQAVRVEDVAIEDKETRPPKRLTEANLLTAMETAGESLDDKELSRAMKERGLGTPATRASIIETLLAREYIVRDGKSLVPTPKGISLVEAVHPHVKSAAMTGEWESRLWSIERGEAELEPFMRAIEAWIIEVLGGLPPPVPGSEPLWNRPPGPGAEGEAAGPSAARAQRAPAAAPFGEGRESPASRAQRSLVAPAGASPPAPPLASARGHRIESAEGLRQLLGEVFHHERFRPHQEEVCRTAFEGRDALLVMPTGAGKSLCYQLPGLARGGTTLVVSPLIALMEDQVAKLKALGLAAERIHSGRTRLQSRAVCVDYLAGNLDYLFIAPERLAVPGFPEFLAKRTPSLVAIDEAHCISQWGHDFRPEYRMLGQRLPALRPAPVIALTATATPQVQEDIAEQLRLAKARRFIHGFRRTNIAIEVVEVQKPERPRVAEELLEDPARRPAILYCSSRKNAEALAERLHRRWPTAAYHAGMSASARDKVQTDFLSGKLEAVVATVAFGMGVDKADIRTVVHLALPQTVEGYYQEIGRAGRDGAPSRAILLHSYVDRRMHEFFLEQNYPEVEILERIQAKIPARGEAREALSRRVRVGGAEVFDAALEKLWIHGGAVIDAEDVVHPGKDGWQHTYAEQRAHREHQAELIGRFSDAHDCRMLHLLRHFGDREDSGEACGICDVCAPSRCVVQPFRRPSGEEVEGVLHLVQVLRRAGAKSAGALFRELESSRGGAGLSRDVFETWISGLSRADLVHVEADSFEKDGELIRYQRVALTERGQTADRSVLEELPLPSAIARSAKSERKTTKKRRPRRDAAAKKPRARRERRERSATRLAPELAEAPSTVVDALKSWRLAEARRRRVPAFRVLTDKALLGIAVLRPRSSDGLSEVQGVGPKAIQSYGAAIIEVVSKAEGKRG